MEFVGVGWGRWAATGGFDFSPLAAVAVAILVTRFVLRRRLTVASCLFAAAAGTAWAWSVESWGVLPPTLAILAVVWVVTLPRSTGPSS